MYDLIYGGDEFKEELQTLFPKATITNASDEIHEGRIALELEIDDDEYRRIVFLNGFGNMSLNIGMWMMEEKDKVLSKVKEWKEKYPEFFKTEVKDEK